jgi:hypothetical protein
VSYFEQDDVLHLAISDEPEAGSVEVGPNITAELNAEGELIGHPSLVSLHFISNEYNAEKKGYRRPQRKYPRDTEPGGKE